MYIVSGLGELEKKNFWNHRVVFFLITYYVLYMNILFYNCLISPFLQIRGAIKSSHRKVHIVSKLRDLGKTSEITLYIYLAVWNKELFVWESVNLTGNFLRFHISRKPTATLFPSPLCSNRQNVAFSVKNNCYHILCFP